MPEDSSFCDRLISLSIVSPGFILVVFQNLLPFKGWLILHCVAIPRVVYSFKDPWVAFTFWLLHMMLLGTWMCKNLFNKNFK